MFTNNEVSVQLDIIIWYTWTRTNPFLTKFSGGKTLASIVLVDDDIDIVNLFEHFLTIQGHEILGKAFDGEEAISIVTNLPQKPEIILMDHRMPQISGLQATESITESFPGIKIILISADMKVEQQAKDHGASAFLLKPVSFKNVLAKIQELNQGENSL